MFVERWLKPTKQKKCRRKIYGFDVETSDSNRNVYLIGLYGNGIQETFYSAKDFFEYIVKHRSYFKHSWIVATNLHFDLFCAIWQDKNFIKNFKWLCKGKTSELLFAKTYIVNGKFSPFPDRDRMCVTFIDSWNFDRCSVESMGKIIGIEKLEKPKCVETGTLPKTPQEWRQTRQYNLRDAEVTYRYMLYLRDTFESFGGTMKLTTPATALSIFTNRFLKTKYYRHDKSILLEQMEGYYGGRTEAFERGDAGEYLRKHSVDEGHVYDVNSLYPYVMKNFSYPDPNTMRITHRNTLHYIRKYEGMSRVIVHVPMMRYPPLPKRHNNMVVFPCGIWEGYYCHNEIRRAMELGVKVLKVFRTMYFKKTCQPFKRFVTDFFNIRMEYKKASDRREKTTKLTMNSLYGKFGQRFINREYIGHKDTFTIDDLKQKGKFQEIGDFIRIGGMETEPAPFCIPIWAAYVTAWARIHLLNLCLLYNPVYVDTDSIFTYHIAPTSDDLGALKLESTFHGGYIVRSKFYAVINAADEKQNKIKLKGSPLKLSKEAFYYLVRPDVKDVRCENGTHALIGIDEKGSAICQFCRTVFTTKFGKLKECLRKSLQPNEVIPIHKLFKHDDTKHLWEGPFDMEKWQVSLPLTINETGLNEKQMETMEKEIQAQEQPNE